MSEEADVDAGLMVMEEEQLNDERKTKEIRNRVFLWENDQQS